MLCVFFLVMFYFKQANRNPILKKNLCLLEIRVLLKHLHCFPLEAYLGTCQRCMMDIFGKNI